MCVSECAVSLQIKLLVTNNHPGSFVLILCLFLEDICYDRSVWECVDKRMLVIVFGRELEGLLARRGFQDLL